MKKILLIALLFNGILSVFQLFSLEYNLDLYTDFSAYGGKLLLPVSELRLYAKEKNVNQGISFFTNRVFPKFSVILKEGNLTLGGGLSKLNTPSLTPLSSPFSTPSTSSLDLTAALPSYTSFSKEQSFFLSAGYVNRKTPVQNIKFSAVYAPYTDGTVCAAAFLLKVKEGKNTALTLSASAGIFPYEESSFSSWFTDRQFYLSDRLFSSNLQFFAKLNHFNTNNVVTLYEAPDGNPLLTYRSENALKTRRFNFNLCAFYNPNDYVLTSSQKNLTKRLQFKGGGQYQFITGIKEPLFIKTGLNAYVDIPFNEDKYSSKLMVGVKISADKINSSITAALNGTLERTSVTGLSYDFDSITLVFQNSFFTKYLKPIFTFQANAAIDSKKEHWTTNEKLGIKLTVTPPKIALCTVNGSIAFKQKDYKHEDIEYSLSLNAKFYIKDVSCTFKYEFEF